MAETEPAADALVLFGATGDLAKKMLFPALAGLVRRGRLRVPVIGVAKSGWSLDELRVRVRESLATAGRLDALDPLCERLAYIDGDYRDERTFAKLKQALGRARRPVCYLAIPPSLFATVVQGIGRAGITGEGRVIVENGAIRDVVQNHLLQVIGYLAMEPPIGADRQAIRDEVVKVFRATRPLTNDVVVRGQFRGYRDERGVAPASDVETYVALRLDIDTFRWEGVPFFIRTGKRLPVTATEVLVRLKRPPSHVAFPDDIPVGNTLRFRLGPDVLVALGARAKRSGEALVGESVELCVAHCPASEETPYERLLGDALRGDTTLFARQDGVEAAWRIVDGVVRSPIPPILYEPGSWGPREADALVAGFGGWVDPAG
jgi:glucose-6-phosphate 1-dehydrogenase